MVIQLGSDINLSEQPRFLVDYFLRHGHMPLTSGLELTLRPHWKWAAPVIVRAIGSRKNVPGYADNRYVSAHEMAQDIARTHGG